MVNNGHADARTVRLDSKDIQYLDYQPPAPYSLDLEIFSMLDLRKRVDKEHLGLVHCYSFYMLLCVTHGKCKPMVDFKPVHCEPGSLLVIQPAQSHRFGLEQDWDGLIVLFRPEFLESSPFAATQVSDLKLVERLERLPVHLSLEEAEHSVVVNSITQMREDSGIEASPTELNELLRHQLYSLLLRLDILHVRQDEERNATTVGLQRFKRFQQLVGRNFAKWHQVVEYADQMGCSEKSLTRATMDVAGVTAKTFIASRINLEAKRLLAHTTLPVLLIGEQLGFEDPTNFVKFFKREAGCTPGNFRRKQER